MADLWEQWMRMALDSQKGGVVAEDAACWRSAASRYYYAAYQAATAFLQSRKLTPPIVEGQRRESWSHVETPELLRTHLKPFIGDSGRRNELSSKLSALYKVRVLSDYVSVKDVSRKTVDSVRRDSGHLIKGVQRIVEGV